MCVCVSAEPSDGNRRGAGGLQRGSRKPHRQVDLWGLARRREAGPGPGGGCRRARPQPAIPRAHGQPGGRRGVATERRPGASQGGREAGRVQGRRLQRRPGASPAAPVRCPRGPRRCPLRGGASSPSTPAPAPQGLRATGEGVTPGMVTGARVWRYTQQKGQPRSGQCHAVRGRRGWPSAGPAVSRATQGTPYDLRHAVAPALAGLRLWLNVHRPHGSGSPSARAPARKEAQGTATPQCLHVSRANEGNAGRDRNRVASALEMEVHTEVRRRVGRSGWLLPCRLIQGSRAGSGVGR